MSSKRLSGIPPGPNSPFVPNGHAADCAAAAAGARARHAAALAAAPRIVTTGGNPFPPEIPQGPTAHIDYFAFTVKPPEGKGLDWLFPQLVELFHVREATATGKKFQNYSEGYKLDNKGMLGIGGETQRGTIHVSLTGTGCMHVPDWLKVMEWGESLNVKITRIDLAHDDLEGRHASIAIALEWLEAGRFAANGRPPKGRLIDDLGSGEGKSLYVGNRKNGKLCRVYEKGRQLGDKSSPWTRVEVEFRNKSRVIPWSVLANPGHYLAGAYPCLAFLSAVHEKIRTIAKAVTISLARAVHHARQMTGRLVNVLMQKHFGDAFAVVDEIIREGVPRRLENYADFLPQVIAGAAP